jgi:uncharacterized protein YabE (DUF348 family)
LKRIFVKILNNLRSKTGFAVLCLLFVFLSIYLVSTFGGVKGDTTKTIYTVVWDDQNRSLLKSTSEDMGEILKQNNIGIYPEDVVTTELILDPITDGGAGQKIVIKRAPVYHVTVDGGTMDVRSWGKNVSDVISGKISLGVRDTVSPILESVAVPGDIIITRINVVETEEVVVVPFLTKYIDEYFIASGTESLITSGANGSKIRYLKITYKNGIEISRVVTGETLVSAPKAKTVKRGLMPSSNKHFNSTYWNWMVEAGQKYGISPVDLYEVADCESHVNPNSHSSSGLYHGMYQYSDGLWESAFMDAGYPVINPDGWKNAEAQIFSTARYASLYGWRKWATCAP